MTTYGERVRAARLPRGTAARSILLYMGGFCIGLGIGFRL
jgi:hypothetical protein